MEEIMNKIGAIMGVCGIIGFLVTIVVIAFHINIFLGFIILFGEMTLLGGMLLDTFDDW